MNPPYHPFIFENLCLCSMKLIYGCMHLSCCSSPASSWWMNKWMCFCSELIGPLVYIKCSYVFFNQSPYFVKFVFPFHTQVLAFKPLRFFSFLSIWVLCPQLCLSTQGMYRAWASKAGYLLFVNTILYSGYMGLNDSSVLYELCDLRQFA